MEEEVIFKSLTGAIEALDREVSRLNELLEALDNPSPQVSSTVIDYFYPDEVFNLKAKQALMFGGLVSEIPIEVEVFADISPFLTTDTLSEFVNQVGSIKTKLADIDPEDIELRKQLYVYATGDGINEETGNYLTDFCVNKCLDEEVLGKLNPPTEPTTPGDCILFIEGVKEALVRLIELEVILNPKEEVTKGFMDVILEP